MLALVVLAIVVPAAAGAQKEYAAQRFESRVAVQPDGSLLVREDITFRFEGGPFTYVVRELALRQLSGIDGLQATLDGRPLPEGRTAGSIEIEDGDPIRATWHVEPLEDSSHTFGLSYRVEGALRREGEAARLIWRVVPEQHEYAIESGQVTFELPSGARLLGRADLDGARVLGSSAADDRVTLRFDGVAPDTPVDLTVDFDPGVIPLPADADAPQASSGWTFDPGILWIALGLAGVGGVAGIGSVVGWWRKAWADRPAVPPTHLRVELPAKLPPALAATLLGGRSPALGTLFDLAAREVIRIEQSPTRWNQRSYSITWSATPQPSLLPHEQGLLRALFKPPAGPGASVSISDAGPRLAADPPGHQQPLRAQLIDRGWLDLQLEKERNRMLAAGVLGFLLGSGLVILGMIGLGLPDLQGIGWVPLLGGVMAGLGGAAGMAGIAALVLSVSITALTPDGESRRAAWRGFEMYLKDVARGGSMVVQTRLFDRYLPYAAAFGMASSWARHFQKLGVAEVPSWFHGLEAADFGDVTAAIVASTMSVSTSADGGAGASGGGASGAG